LPRCWFNEAETEDGRKALRNYSFAFDQKRQVFSQSPLHDANSNFADSFEVLAVGLRQANSAIENNPAPTEEMMGLAFDDERAIVPPFEPDSSEW